IEDWASNGALEREGLGIEEWATRFNKFLKITELLVAPQLFILGGGLSKRFAEYEHLINTKTPIRVAALKNNAGIVGAAAAALK
ncbi:MAG: ROK family protein, partial [Bacteroidetes bacterium]|nr:ROK family protein [Bacteroidota bacterium]